MSAPHGVLRRLLSHNPLYLASAASMLGACYLLTGADSRQTSGLGQVLPILAWLTLYEVTLIGFGGYLHRRGLARDARTILVIEAVLLADLTNLTAETVAFSDHWLRATVVLMLLAAGKVALACAAYRLRPRTDEVLWAASAFTWILLLPSLGRGLARHGADLELPLYGAAWLTAAFLMLVTLDERTSSSPLLGGLRVFLPLSLGAHVIALHWQYGVAFHLSSLSPLLLALAVLVIRRVGPHAPMLRLALPGLAILLSREWAEACVFDLGPWLPVFSPLRATLLLGTGVFIYDWYRHRQPATAAVAAACGFVALAGHTYGAAVDNVLQVVATVFRGVASGVPHTRRQWGAMAMVGAWLLLIGAGWISLRSRSTPTARS